MDALSMTLDLKLKLNEYIANFLNHYQDYGFESQESMIQSALEKLKQDFDESAKLYGEVYQEDKKLQELTEATSNINPIRNHQAFLNGYSPEDEGLYDDYPTR
ncbi:MAG: hypothetical protein AB4062_04190 [Crocosphaera sp.]